MRFKNPHFRGTLHHKAWDDIRNHARLIAEFPAGSERSRLLPLFEALVAGIAEGRSRTTLSQLSELLEAAFRTVQSSLRKEDDLGTGPSDTYSPSGFRRIPEWAFVLKLLPPFKRYKIISRYRALCKLHHPDRPGGSEEMMKRVNLAYEQAIKEVKE